MPDRDVVLKGYFRPGENTPYTIHHYLETLTDGVYEEEPAVIESNFTGTTGHTVTAIPLNRFTGFKYNETKSEATISGQILADGSLVLEVYYDRELYNVTYGYDGDIPADAPQLPETRTYVYGTDVEVAAKATAPDGYSFVGWYRGTSDNPVEGTFTMPSFNVHILGNFVEDTNTPYKVEHYLQTEDGSGYALNSRVIRHGKTGVNVGALPKEYVGFTYNRGISIPSGIIRGDGTLVLRFCYDRNPYNVVYMYDGIVPEGAPDAPDKAENILYGTEFTVAASPEVPGYTFSGWTSASVAVENGKFTMPDKNVVLKGNFQSNEVEYQVNYWFQKLDAGSTFNKADYELDADSYTRKAYVGQHVEANDKAHRGFYVNEANSTSYGHVTVDENGVGNLVLDIYFDRYTYDVTYDYYGEQPADAPDLSGKNKTNVRYGTVVEVDSKPQMDGYSFDGWYTRTATVENNKFTMPAHDVDILGRFVTQHIVSYDLNGGKGAENVDYSTKAVDVGTNITVNAAPTRSGYTFKGWKEDETSYKAGDTVKVDKNLHFVAQWSSNGGGGGGGGGTSKTYTLTYVTNGGNEIASETYVAGKTVKLVKNPVREGYVFEGWHADADLAEDVKEVKMTKDITVYADWVKDNGNAGNGHTTPGDLNGEDHFAYVVGYPDGTVRPNDNISRAEVTAIFFRLLKAEVRDGNLTSENIFNDVNDPDWHNAAVSTMAKLDIVKGRGVDRFAPDEFITRAEFATICARFDDSGYEVVDNFTDVSGHWAENEIHEAAAHGWIRGYEDNTFKPDQFITRAEAMTMINRVLNRIPETAEDLHEEMVKWPDNSDVSVWYYIPVQEATNSHEYSMKNKIYEKWTAIREVTDWTKYE